MPLKVQKRSVQGLHYIRIETGVKRIGLYGCARGYCCVILLSTLNSGESGTLKSL